MKNRRPRKYKKKYLGKIKDVGSAKFGRLLREMRSYPMRPTEAFLIAHGNTFPVNELKV